MTEAVQAADAVQGKEPKRRSPGSVARGWWAQLTRSNGGDPGALARLRRARSTAEALGEPAAMVLVRRLRESAPPRGGSIGNLDRRAVDLGRVLAHVREDDGQLPMRAVGWATFPYAQDGSAASESRPRLSEARFRRLMKAERDNDELVTAFIRLVRLMDGRCNVARLAEHFLFWGAEQQERMAFDYYAAGSINSPTSIATTGDDE